MSEQVSFNANEQGYEPSYSVNLATADLNTARRTLRGMGLVDRVIVRKGAKWPTVLAVGFVLLLIGVTAGVSSQEVVNMPWETKTIQRAWWLGTLKAVTVGLGVIGAFAVAIEIFDAIRERYAETARAAIAGQRTLMSLEKEQLAVERERISVENHRLRGEVAIFRPDTDGRKGVVYNGKTFYDLDTARVFEKGVVTALHPVMEQMEKVLEGQRALAKAIPSHTYTNHVEHITGDSTHLLQDGQDAEDQEQERRALRTHIALADLERTYGRGNYHNMLIGETVNEHNEYAPVRADMTDMVHLLISGGTKWGKSTLLESMAKQLAASGDCDLCFVDLGVNTFGMLADHALYPIAETPGLVVALFRQLCAEMERRRQAMSEYPKVKNLDQYNRASGDSLRPIVVFCDEASVLFDKSIGAQDMATDLARMGRKYAIGVCFAGTDFRAETLPTSARGNCGARFSFHLDEPGLSRSIIRSAQATNLRHPGRALALLPGKPMVEVQCPIVEKWDDLPRPRGTVIELKAEPVDASDKSEPVDFDAIDDSDLTKEERVVILHDAGMSDTAIAGRLWHPNPFYLAKVRGVLAEQSVIVVAKTDDDSTGSSSGPVFVHNNNNNNKMNGTNK